MFASTIRIKARGKPDVRAVVKIDDAFGRIFIKFGLDGGTFLFIQKVAIRLEFDLVEPVAGIGGSATAFDDLMGGRVMHKYILPHKCMAIK